jgi:hypothetical protein
MEGAAQVPWDRIISAAAASTLGIVSLALLIVAVVAVLLFKGSGDRTRLIVFGAVVAMALVGLAVAVLRERGDAAATTGAGPVVAASAGATPSEVALSPAEPSTAPADGPAAGGAQAATTTDAGGGDLNGLWHSDDGFAYQVTVEGSRFGYIELFEGVPVGSGEGTIEGRRLRYNYINERTLDRGECNGLVSADRMAVDGTCGNGEDSWGFRIERGGA